MYTQVRNAPHRVPPIQARFITKPKNFVERKLSKKIVNERQQTESEESCHNLLDESLSIEKSTKSKKNSLMSKVCGLDMKQYKSQQLMHARKPKLGIFHCQNILISNGDSICISADNSSLQLQKYTNDQSFYNSEPSIINLSQHSHKKRRKKGIFESSKNPVKSPNKTRLHNIDDGDMHIVFETEEIVECCL